MTYDVDALRDAEFPWTTRGDVVYLNHAATGPLPRRTVECLQQWAELRAEPWRVSDRENVFPALARTRELCASLIGASAAEIALAGNTAMGLNLAARALPLAPDDVVLSLDGEIPANVYPWLALERSRGVRLHWVRHASDISDEDTLLRALDEVPRVRLLTISWVSFATGRRADLARLGAVCRERGIYFVVDASQGAGVATLDAHACYIDVLACTGQKWLLSPWGTGFTYVRRELIAELEPITVGWLVGERAEDYTHMTEYALDYYADARRFEVMTLPSQDLIAMGRSVELVLELGVAAVESHVRGLIDRIIESAGEHRLVIRTPLEPAHRAGIATLEVPDVLSASARLRSASVAHSVREGAIRLSPHCYSTSDDVDAALRALAISGDRAA